MITGIFEFEHGDCDGRTINAIPFQSVESMNEFVACFEWVDGNRPITYHMNREDALEHVFSTWPILRELWPVSNVIDYGDNEPVLGHYSKLRGYYDEGGIFHKSEYNYLELPVSLVHHSEIIRNED